MAPADPLPTSSTGNIPYGGHILDQGDAEAVQSLSKQCLGSEDVARLLGSGLPSLLAAVRGSPIHSEQPAPRAPPPGLPPPPSQAGHPAPFPSLSSPPELPAEEAAVATRERIRQLPCPMEPAWVGLCNGLQRELGASRSRAMLAALQVAQGLWQPQRPPGTQQKVALEELVGQWPERVQELQEQLEQCGWEVGARGFQPRGQLRPKARPLQRFLLEEAGSLLALLQQLQRDLECGQEHLQGPPCSSPRCAAVLQELQQGRVPRHWLRYTPTGPQPPQAWLETLRCRCQLLCHYLRAQALGGPYQLAAFLHPRRLFLALRQETARTEKQELNRYYLELQVGWGGPAGGGGEGAWAWLPRALTQPLAPPGSAHDAAPQQHARQGALPDRPGAAPRPLGPPKRPAAGHPLGPALPAACRLGPSRLPSVGGPAPSCCHVPVPRVPWHARWLCAPGQPAGFPAPAPGQPAGPRGLCPAAGPCRQHSAPGPLVPPFVREGGGPPGPVERRQHPGRERASEHKHPCTEIKSSIILCEYKPRPLCSSVWPAQTLPAPPPPYK